MISQKHSVVQELCVFPTNSKHCPSFTQDPEPRLTPESIPLQHLLASSHGHKRPLAPGCWAKVAAAAGNGGSDHSPTRTHLTHGIHLFVCTVQCSNACGCQACPANPSERNHLLRRNVGTDEIYLTGQGSIVQAGDPCGKDQLALHNSISFPRLPHMLPCSTAAH